MSRRAIAFALLLSVSVAPAPAQAQDASDAVAGSTKPLTAADLEALRAELRSSRKQIMAQTLILSDAEATRFWPIYDRYQTDLTKIKDDQYKLIAEYANTYGRYDDKTATDFIRRWLDLDVRTTALRAKYVPIVGEALPGVKAATFFQIDRRVSMAIDRRIASLLPLLELQEQLKRPTAAR